MPSPLVSVVVAHYGDPCHAVELVELLRTQTMAAQIEVLVVDDASPTAFVGSEGVQVIRRTNNGGFGSAMNSGAAAATAPLLLFLNSDLQVDASFVESLVTAAQPWQPAVVSPRVVGRDGSDEWVGRHFPRAHHHVVEWLHPLVRMRPRLHGAVGHDTQARGHTSVVDWVMGAAMLVPTSCFRDVGGFDERFHMNSEEVDLQRRLRARGVPSVVVSAPRVIHEGGGSSASDLRRQWVVDSRMIYTRKWDGARGERRLKAALLTASAVNLVWNSARRLVGRDIDARGVFTQEVQYVMPRSGQKRTRGRGATAAPDVAADQ